MSKNRAVFNLSEEGKRLLKIVAHNWGLPMNNALEVIIRQEADRQGIERQMETEDIPEAEAE